MKRNALLNQMHYFERFYNNKNKKMVKRKIDAYDSVQFVGGWQSVKEKKEKIKAMSQKAVNSQFYLTFSDVNTLYTFLYLALAPDEALKFQKIQSMLDKMKGGDEQSMRRFQECRNALNLNWDGVTPLPDIMRRQKNDIMKEQENLAQISSKITQDQGKQLLKSGLSQRKVHLDFQNHDGSSEEAIIPTKQNVNDCMTIIHETNKNKYLLAFLSHVQQQVTEQIKTQKLISSRMMDKENRNRIQSQKKIMPTKRSDMKGHNVAQTFKDRPILQNVPNPDDRPLPTPKENEILKNITRSHKNMPNPEQHSQPQTKPMPTIPRQILDPDQKLLPPPPKEMKSKIQREKRKSSGQENQLKKDIKKIGEKIECKAHEISEKAKQIGHKVQEKVEQVVEDMKRDNFPWVSLALAGVVAAMAVKVLRA